MYSYTYVTVISTAVRGVTQLKLRPGSGNK